MVGNVMSRESITRMMRKGAESGELGGGTVPSFVVWRGDRDESDSEMKHGNKSGPTLRDQVEKEGLKYPLIGKPLVAASTRESHQLVVALDERGLKDLPRDCIVQSYENHSGILYKVYVIGRETVRVFPRPSLPDLPSRDDENYEFDNNIASVEVSVR